MRNLIKITWSVLVTCLFILMSLVFIEGINTYTGLQWLGWLIFSSAFVLMGLLVYLEKVAYFFSKSPKDIAVTCLLVLVMVFGCMVFLVGEAIKSPLVANTKYIASGSEKLAAQLQPKHMGGGK